MRQEDKYAFMKYILPFIVLSVFFLPIGAVSVDASEKTNHHLVILGDPHLPGNKVEFKKQVIQTINSWNDVDMVVAVGDICEDRGTNEEYAAAKEFFAKLKKPLYPIAGNHDFIYADSLDVKGRRQKAAPDAREAKLRRFRETFGLKDISYSTTAGNYFLIFLSADSPEHLAEISQKQLEWLRSELEKKPKAANTHFFSCPLGRHSAKL